jgi:hypothetical protein
MIPVGGAGLPWSAAGADWQATDASNAARQMRIGMKRMLEFSIPWPRQTVPTEAVANLPDFSLIDVCRPGGYLE